MIRNGHRLEDIRGYTLGQCRAFLAAIDEEQRARDLAHLIITRAAFADSKGFESILKVLSRDE